MEHIHYLLDISNDDKKRLFIFIFWIAIIFLSVYYLPSFIGILISFILFFYTLYTKNDALILAIFYITASGIGGTIKVNDLPRITLMAGISLSLLDLMIVSMIIKVISKKNIFRSATLSKFFLIFFLYLIMNYIFTTMTYGLNLDIGLNFFRIFFYYILYFYFIYSIKDIRDISFLLKIFFFVFLIVFAFQLLLFFGKINIRTYLARGELGRVTMFKESYGQYDIYKTNAVRAVMNDVLTPFLIFILSLGLLNNVKSKKMNNLFVATISIFIISIFMSATRVWVAILSITLIGFLRFKKNIRKFIRIAIIGILLFISIFMFIGETTLSFVHDILVRIGGLAKVATGKLQNVGTALSRLNQLQHLNKLISKKMTFGYGFSKISYLNTNTNFGFINTILIFGVVGLIIIIYLLITYIVKVKNVLSKISLYNPYYKILYIFLYAWYAIIVAYAFTWDFFTLRIMAVVFMSLFLGFTDFFLREAIKYQRNIINKTEV